MLIILWEGQAMYGVGRQGNKDACAEVGVWRRSSRSSSRRSGRSGLVHCFFACSSCSRHPGSLYTGDVWLLDTASQRLETPGVSGFSKPLPYGGKGKQKGGRGRGGVGRQK